MNTDTNTLHAVGYRESLPVDDEAALEDFRMPPPSPGPRDLLVEVRAVSVNPVDTKIRKRAAPEEGHKVLGYDAAGVVLDVGAEVTLFAPGDEVFYAGDMTRPGTNAERHVVDERIVGRKPASLGFADAAAFPLTSITAWEMLFEGLAVEEGGGEGDVLLIVGGAGGVGSILTQLAKTLTRLTVVATASREETRAWCTSMGADHVIDHHGDIPAQLRELGLVPSHVAALTASDRHFATLVEVIRPLGRMSMIDDPGGIDISLIKQKALTFHFEFMFARSKYGTPDMIRQHELLGRVAELIEAGRLRTTATTYRSPIDAATLREAHALQESGRAIGKTVLSGWSDA